MLEPTRIYVHALLTLLDAVPVKAMAHITGGGITENIPRVLPSGTVARVDPGAWPTPDVFGWLRSSAAVDDAEMRRTFNCGIGMVVCVAPEHADAAAASLRGSGETCWTIGAVEAGEGAEVVYG